MPIRGVAALKESRWAQALTDPCGVRQQSPLQQAAAPPTSWLTAEEYWKVRQQQQQLHSLQQPPERQYNARARELSSLEKVGLAMGAFIVLTEAPFTLWGWQMLADFALRLAKNTIKP